jgi:hypothetical protein
MNDRKLIWFSCGAASAVTAKLGVEKYPDAEVLYCDTLAYEHPDNRRFMEDVEEWIGTKVVILSSEKYTDIFDVFRKTRYIVGTKGATCTRALKREVRMAYQQPDDTHLFGLTADEGDRIREFEQRNPSLFLEWILQENGITKRDCYRIVSEAGIELPEMYKLGYKNNNCIGCVKGGMGYWNKIRKDFPESFNRMALMERELNAACCRKEVKENGKRRSYPVFLDELDPSWGRFDDEPDFECGPQCVMPVQFELVMDGKLL